MFLYLSAINCVPCAKKKAAVFGETMDLEGDTQSPWRGENIHLWLCQEWGSALNKSIAQSSTFSFLSIFFFMHNRSARTLIHMSFISS